MCGILAVFGIRGGGGIERYRGDVIRLSKQGSNSIGSRTSHRKATKENLFKLIIVAF